VVASVRGDAGVGDAGVGATGTLESGAVLFIDVPAAAPASSYSFTYKHPTFNCGAAVPVTAVPGFIYDGAGAVCGNGVAQ
jgi:hypothetical protein